MDKVCLEWEQEIYNQFYFIKDDINPRIYIFEADISMALLFFADEKEANVFNEAVQKRIENIAIPASLSKSKPHIIITNRLIIYSGGTF